MKHTRYGSARPTLSVEETLARAWRDADTFAQSQFDANSRFSMMDLDRDPECPNWRRARIDAVKTWWSAVWNHYAQVRYSIVSGNTEIRFDQSIPGNCPWTIWQIVEES